MRVPPTTLAYGRTLRAMVLWSCALCSGGTYGRVPTSQGPSDEPSPAGGGGARSSPPPHNVTVHICPTTHMDPGWFQTVDELYEQLFKASITNVTSALEANPTRTHVPEIAVIWAMWVGEMGAPAQHTLAKFVAEKRLEFVGGGWVQPDEAITRFEDIIDQQTLGHMWLSSMLSHPPIRAGWQADPFGHSNTMAYVNALNCYDAHILGRPMSPYDPIDEQSSVLWHPMQSAAGDADFDAESSTMTYDTDGYWEPYRSMRPSFDSGDVAGAAKTLEGYAQHVYSTRRTQRSNLLVMLGDDAPLQSPWATVYGQLDEIIAALNAKSASTGFTYKYSTPSAWISALAADKPSLPSRPAWDMLPLVGNEFPYWTGYFTSRSEFKQTIHDGSAYFRGASMLHALGHTDRSWLAGVAELLTLWRAVGLAQHHDIITGDCFGRVAEDNTVRLRAGVANAAQVASSAIAIMMGGIQDSVGEPCTNYTLTPCIPLAAALESRAPVTVTFFNPLSWARVQYVSLLVPTASIVAVNGAGKSVPVQLAAYSAPDLSPSSNWSSLVFPVSLPALGVAAVTVTATGATQAAAPEHTPTADNDSIVLSNKRLTATFSSNGTLQSLACDGAEIDIVAKAMYYSCAAGHENAWSMSTDNTTSATDFAHAATQTVAWSTTGPLFSELAINVNTAQGVVLRYRLYANEAQLHLYTTTGPFTTAQRSTDALIRFETSIASKNRWFTDSNGLELVPRTRWARPFTSNVYDPRAAPQDFPGPEPVAVNMYPVTAAAVLADSDATQPALGLVTANSHGCTSMSSGSIELTLNRAALDVNGTSLTGNRRVTQHTILVVGKTMSATTTAVRTVSAAMSNPALAFAAPSMGGMAPSISGLGHDFPPELALVSLQLLPQDYNLSSLFSAAPMVPLNISAAVPSMCGALLVRLRHIYQVGDDSELAQSASVDLTIAFAAAWTITEVVELTVDGSAPMDTARAVRIVWAEHKNGTASTSTMRGTTPNTVVSLRPMQIKTFLLKLS